MLEVHGIPPVPGLLPLGQNVEQAQAETSDSRILHEGTIFPSLRLCTRNRSRRAFLSQTSHREVTKLIIELIRNKLRLCPTRTVAINAEDSVADAIRLRAALLYNICVRVNVTHCIAATLFLHSNETRRADCGSLRSTIRRKILSDPQKELQSIITHLEEENRQLQIELLDIRGTKAERLQRHRATIESQLQRLKTLKVL